MTNIDDNIVKRRVLVDWDGDGFLNEGVLQSTPLNLFPNSLYTSSTYIKGYNAALTSSNYTDTPDASPRGLVRRSVRLGDQAITTRFMWDDYLPYQPRPSDPVNSVSGTANFNSDTWAYMAGWEGFPVSQLLNIAKKPPEYDNGKLGYYVGAVPMPFTAGGIAQALGMTGTTFATANRYANVGFHDVGLQYSKAIDATSTAIGYNGMTVVAGQQYTFVAYFMARLKDMTAGSTSAVVRPRLYTNGGIATTPNFTRQYVGGTDITLPANTWTAMVVTFTAPAGATNLALDFQHTALTTNAIYVGGLMLMPGSVAAPTRLWDSAVTYNESQFSYAFPADSLDYVVSYWVRSTNGITKLTPTKHVVTLGSNTIVDTALTAINVTADWQRVNMAVAPSASKRGVWLTYTAEKSGVPVDASHAGDIEFSGFMITQGTITNYPFHSGTLYGYDDITDYVISLTTQNGKSDFNSALPEEGTAEVVLNNNDKRFSPSNVDSPLYTYLTPNLKVKIQVYDNDNEAWVAVWSGWTHDFNVEPGRNSTRQATLSCQQGMYRLADGTLAVPVTAATRMDVLARAIIESSGWRSTSNVLQSFVGLRTLVGKNAYTMDTTLMYKSVEQGVNAIEMSGRDWSQGVDPRKALEDVLAAENAQMWINRDGSITIVNRDHWISDDPDDVIVLDTEVNRAQYVYGQDLINSVDITITRNKIISNANVWETKRPVQVRPNQVWTIDLNPEYTEGRTRTVIQYTLEGITKTFYNKDIGIVADTANSSLTDEQQKQINVELLGNAGERPQIRITNSNVIDIWVDLKVKGNYLDTGDSSIVKVEDAASVDEVQGRHLLTYSNPVLTSDRQAASYGEYIILRQGEPHGEIEGFSITVRNSEDLARVLSLSIGSIVELSEAQSAEDSKLHTITSESIEITDSRTLTISYTTTRTLQERYAKASVTVAADATVNMIEDQYNLKVTNGGSTGTEIGEAFGLDRIQVWQTGVGYDSKLVLAPSRDQLRLWQPVVGVAQFPTAQSDSSPFSPWGSIADYRERYMPFSPSWVLPTGHNFIHFYVPGTVRNGFSVISSAQAFLGARRSKTVDESTGAASTYELLLPLLPDAKYIARSQIIYGSSDQYSARPSGQILKAITETGGSLSQWGSTTAAPSNTAVAQYNGANRHIEHVFRARKATSGIPVSTFGWQTYANSAGFETEGLVNISLLRYSDYAKVGGLFLDTTVAHKYTLFARTDYAGVPVSYTLTVIAEDGSTISTDAHTISNTTITKFEVTIPSGNKSAWAYLQKTTNDYRDTKLYIYAYGITLNSVSSYTDLLTPTDQELVYA